MARYSEMSDSCGGRKAIEMKTSKQSTGRQGPAAITRSGLARRKSDWGVRNRARLMKRTAFLAELPSGEVLFLPESLQQLCVVRQRKQLRLVFQGQDSPLTQSRMRLDDPLYLLAPYAQIMMLALIWREQPERIYMAGFGAGRIPQVLHHYFPEVVVDCTEIDPDVLAVAQSHFGIRLDHRLRVTIMDGRAYLEGKTEPGNYDLLFVDLSDGTASSPIGLASTDFYALCQRHLARDGVVVVNLLHGDARYREKVELLRAAGQTLYAGRTTRGGTVFFAVNSAPMSATEINALARQLARQHRFGFPFVKHARRLMINPTAGETV